MKKDEAVGDTLGSVWDCFTSPNSTSLRETVAKHPQLHQLSFTKKCEVGPNFTKSMKQPKGYFTNSRFELPREVGGKLPTNATDYTPGMKRFSSISHVPATPPPLPPSVRSHPSKP
jgi:hypothetical protein